MQKPNNLPLVITVGDPRGIGPEILAKGFRKFFRKNPRFLNKKIVVLGERNWFPKNFKYKNLEIISVLPLDSSRPLTPRISGKYCGLAIEQAARGCLQGKYCGMVTGPIDKTALNAGGFHYNGHTDMLADLCQKEGYKLSRPETMMLANSFLRVSLVTTHISLAKVPTAITETRILNTIANTLHGLKQIFKVQKPRLAVLGLNPHCGDKGLFGREEIEIIAPAILKAKKAFAKEYPNLVIDGPFSSDGFFPRFNRVPGPKQRPPFDAVIALYHDQGLIPVKLLDFSNSVNITLGLPLLRTSVDHGVAFDIAGKNQADSSSFEAALRLALFAQS